jgi:hypothetical protein
MKTASDAIGHEDQALLRCAPDGRQTVVVAGIAATVRVSPRPPSRIDVEDEHTTPKIASLP